MKFVRSEIDAPLTLMNDDEELLTVHAIEVTTYTTESGERADVRLSFLVPGEDYEDWDDEEYCNNFELTRGETFEAFDEDTPVEYEVSLLTALVDDFPDDPNEAGEFLTSLDPDHDLRLTENWHARTVKQERESGIKTGYQTRWDNANIFE